MTNIRNALMQAAGSASGDKVYVEDVFSTFLYTGNGSNGLAIDNGIDLAGEGGLVWIKGRTSGGVGSDNHSLATTEQGLSNQLASDLSNGNISWGNIQSYDSDGFTLTNGGTTNTNAVDYVSWTFRKQEGFFDIVTWTGNGSGDQTISHNLGSTPGMIFVKSTSHTNTWSVYHTGAGNTAHGYLSDTDAFGSGADWSATSTTFNADDSLAHNDSGKTYIAYLFASGNDSASQIFGKDGDEAIIKTGSFTPTGSGTAKQTINLGFEPQWLLLKNSTSSQSGNWWIFDNMRGFTAGDGNGSEYLLADTSGAASAFGAGSINITNQGFEMVNNAFVSSSQTFIYMAIRRGPMKEPTAGTDVFDIRTSTSAGSPAFLWNGLAFPPDWAGYRAPVDNGTGFPNSARLIQGKSLATRNSDAVQTSSNMMFDAQDAWFAWGSSGLTGYYSYAWRRYPKVFDVVCYSPLLSDPVPRNVHNHNLTVKPELIIVKQTTAVYGARNWAVGAPDLLGVTSSDTLGLNLDVAEGGTGTYNLFDSTQPTATQFTVGYNTTGVGVFGESYIAYLFASLDGISKVGTYTGTGNDLNVTGLNAAARFVMIKRTDSSGDWFVFDSAMGGIASGNDQYFRMNVAAAPVTGTDYIDPHSSGFTITSSAPAALNASGGTYLYLAFA